MQKCPAGGYHVTREQLENLGKKYSPAWNEAALKASKCNGCYQVWLRRFNMREYSTGDAEAKLQVAGGNS